MLRLLAELQFDRPARGARVNTTGCIGDRDPATGRFRDDVATGPANPDRTTGGVSVDITCDVCRPDGATRRPEMRHPFHVVDRDAASADFAKTKE